MSDEKLQSYLDALLVPRAENIESEKSLDTQGSVDTNISSERETIKESIKPNYDGPCISSLDIPESTSSVVDAALMNSERVSPERAALEKSSPVNPYIQSRVLPQVETRPLIRNTEKPELIVERQEVYEGPSSTTALAEPEKLQLQRLLSQQTLREKIDLSPPKSSPLEIKVELPVAAPTDVKVIPDVVVSEPEKDPVDQHVYRPLAQHLLWAENGRPHWAQERFEALLFDVAGLTLAVPLITLGQVVSLSEDLTPIFGQSEWFMGLLPSNTGQLKVVNTALFVMPERYDESFLKSATQVISLDGVPWALAVNNVDQAVSLNPDEINWRTERSKRSWLAGTVRSQMCALLDIPQMANLFNNSETRR